MPFCRYGFLPPPRTSPRVLVAWVPCLAAACCATTTWWISGTFTVASKTSAGSSTCTSVLAAAGASTVLVVADSSDQLTWKSLRNARGVHLIDPGQLNTYDVLTNDRVIFTRAAYESFVARTGAAGGQEER